MCREALECVEQDAAADPEDIPSKLMTERSMTQTPPVSKRYSEGMATRRQVLGEDHVDRAESAKIDFDAPFQELIVEAAWSHVWSRDQWTRRERSMVTIALLAALGHYDEVAMHVRATANTGATREDIREAMLHVAVYAGVPAANHAIKIVKKTFDEMDAEEAGS